MAQDVNFTTRQKVMAGIIVVIVIFLIYQIMGMMSGEAPITPSVQNSGPTKSDNQAKNTQAQGMQAQGMNNPNVQSNQQQMGQPQQVQALKGLVVANSDVLKKQQEQQQQYLSTVNELQMLKLQKDVAETTQAISAAKLATATAEKNINDIFTKQSSVPVQQDDYAKRLLTPSIPQANQAAPQQIPVIASATPYVVISVSMQLNRWTAVLGYQGKLFSVAIGDVLPVDGSTVDSISNDGVTLKRDNETRKISLVPVI